MNNADILKNTTLSFPIKYEKESQFEPFVGKLLSTFTRLTKKAKLSDKESFFLSTLTNNIPKIVTQYYSGNLTESYKTLHHVLGNAQDIFLAFPKQQYSIGTSFFRIRSKNYLNSKPFEKVDLFHHPFEKRGKVSSQRYSIPSFPCLYVGDSLYVCWEELNRPDLRKIQAVRFQSTAPFSVFNIDFSVYGNPDKINKLKPYELRSYLLLWPLFAVCSIEVQDDRKSDPFKPEYIFPQLLLQYFIPIFLASLKSGGFNDLIGVQYGSTRVNQVLYRQQNNSFFNLVLPPLYEIGSVTNSGHSAHLIRLFDMTEVVDIESQDFKISAQAFPSKVNNIELFKGIESDYSQTELGKIEQYLRSLPATQIDFK
jgi:hypothetical protein